MDGQALQLEANRFDMAGSQFGVMLFPSGPTSTAVRWILLHSSSSWPIRIGSAKSSSPSRRRNTRPEKDLWEWLVWSNPIVEMVLDGMLNITTEERQVVQQTLETLVRKRGGGGGISRMPTSVSRQWLVSCGSGARDRRRQHWRPGTLTDERVWPPARR